MNKILSSEMPPGHPLLETVATAYAQSQGRMTRDLGQARQYLSCIPDGWIRIGGTWKCVDELVD